jgi:hypothetical protein
VLIRREFPSSDNHGSLTGSSTLSLSIKDDVEDLTQMFQRHSTGEFYDREKVVC